MRDERLHIDTSRKLGRCLPSLRAGLLGGLSAELDKTLIIK